MDDVGLIEGQSNQAVGLSSSRPTLPEEELTTDYYSKKFHQIQGKRMGEEFVGRFQQRGLTDPLELSDKADNPPVVSYASGLVNPIATGKRDFELGRIIKRPVNLRIKTGRGKREDFELSRIIKRLVNPQIPISSKRDLDEFEYGRVIKRGSSPILELGRVIRSGGATPSTANGQILSSKQKYSELKLPGDFRIMK